MSAIVQEESENIQKESKKEVKKEVKEVKEEVKEEVKKEIDYEDLERLRKNIEKMEKFHHIEIAKIFKKNNVSLNENNNGLFINLNNVQPETINEVKEYMDYVKKQELDLNFAEKLKENLENKYFKDNKDNLSIYNVGENA